MKTCSRCKIVKALDEFCLCRGMSDGHYSSCKSCEKEKQAARYLANPEIKKAQAKRWRANNRERHRSYCRRYSKIHREEQNKKRRERWGEKNREYHRKYNKLPHVRQRANIAQKIRRQENSHN